MLVRFFQESVNFQWFLGFDCYSSIRGSLPHQQHIDFHPLTRALVKHCRHSSDIASDYFRVLMKTDKNRLSTVSLCSLVCIFWFKLKSHSCFQRIWYLIWVVDYCIIIRDKYIRGEVGFCEGHFNIPSLPGSSQTSLGSIFRVVDPMSYSTTLLNYF